MMTLIRRPRRLRASKNIRRLVQESSLNVNNLIYPLFLVEGEGIKREIPSLPDVFHLSIDQLEDEIEEIKVLGIQGVILFGIPKSKDPLGSQSYAEDGIVQKGIRKIKSIDPNFLVITDICMCQYTSHGHCGVLKKDGSIDNDSTLGFLDKIALSHAKAGADMVAPSDMMDGRIASMRKALDGENFKNTSIMAYSAKYNSSYYGPFREAAHSAPSFGDRKTYQMDPHNSRDAIEEMDLDYQEGADILMVKPALAYLDVIKSAKDRYNIPIAAYNVSGEYSMIKNAIKNNLVNEDIIYETVISIKRAGADIIITYFAKDLAKKLGGIYE
jgi:porphobilinogen synthase